MFCILHQNIEGISKKKEDLLLSIRDLEITNNRTIDVICLTEHFIPSGEECNLHIPGYTLAESYTRKKLKSKKVNSKRGGCCILLRHNLDFKRLDYIKSCSERYTFECCGVLLPFENIIIICVYRVPELSNIDIFFDRLENLLIKLQKKQKSKIILCGDFNIDLLPTARYINIARKFIRLLNSYNLYHQITEHTRITANSKSCIDNIICNFKRNFKTDIYKIGLSDHTAQTLSIKMKRKTIPKFWYISKRDFSKENIEKFVDCLAHLSFSEIYTQTDVDLAFGSFMALYKLFYDLCFPTILMKVNCTNKQKWVTKGIKVSGKIKRKLFIDVKYKGNRSKRDEYLN